VTDEELIDMLAVTARMACRRMTHRQLTAFTETVAQTESLPAKPCWDKKAVAHAEAIGLLGDSTGDPVLMRVAGQAVGWAPDLAVRAGPAADGIIRNSRHRLLRHLRLGDAEAAGREIEAHLRVLCVMARLCRASVAEPAARRPPNAA
jgi:hypothetical protein